jgi:hypothetical protein
MTMAHGDDDDGDDDGDDDDDYGDDYGNYDEDGEAGDDDFITNGRP